MLCGMWASSTALAITAEDKAELERIVRSGRTEQRHALRARIILGAAEGRSNSALAKELKTSRPTVVDWRARYVEGGVKALYEDRPRGKSFEAVARSKEAEIVAKSLKRNHRRPTPRIGAAAAWLRPAVSAKHPCSVSGRPMG